jgi:hypothetical protein
MDITHYPELWIPGLNPTDQAELITKHVATGSPPGTKPTVIPDERTRDDWTEFTKYAKDNYSDSSYPPLFSDSVTPPNPDSYLSAEDKMTFGIMEELLWRDVIREYGSGVDFDSSNVRSQVSEIASNIELDLPPDFDVREYINDGMSLVDVLEGVVPEDIDEATAKRLKAAFPMGKDIKDISAKLLPQWVKDQLASTVKGMMYALITGEDPPPYLLNNPTRLEDQYKKDVVGPFNSTSSMSRQEWLENYRTGVVTNLADAQRISIALLAAPLLLPFSGPIIQKISEFLRFESLKSTIDEAADKSVTSGDETTNIDNRSYTTINEDQDKDLFSDRGPNPPPDTQDYDRLKTLNRDINSLRGLLTSSGRKGSGGGSAHVNCAEILAKYKNGAIAWDQVPNQCRIQLSGVGMPEARGPENDYPTLI